MARVLYGDSQDFNIMAFGMPNMNTVRDLYSHIQSIDRSMYRDTSFIDKTMAMFDMYNGSDALLRARSLLANTDVIVNVNQIRYIPDLVGIQTAPLMMQQYIMANPTIREMYHKNLCDGYSDTYIDVHPDDIGDTHYDYQKVMDGLVYEENVGTEEEPIYRTMINIYPDIAIEDRLLPEEQIDLYNTWEMLEAYLKAGDDDPTSPYGCTL